MIYGTVTVYFIKPTDYDMRRAQWSVTVDMCDSYNILVIARAILMPHVGYWHGSDVEPSSSTSLYYACKICIRFLYNYINFTIILL